MDGEPNFVKQIFATILLFYEHFFGQNLFLSKILLDKLLVFEEISGNNVFFDYKQTKADLPALG